MSQYLKKIAVIKQVKGGFSADGGLVSGLVKAESYAGFLKVELSLINFAGISEGRYVFGITDGKTYALFEDVTFEAESKINIENGFAFTVCFCHGKVSPVASAYCGSCACYLPLLKEEIERVESTAKSAKSDKGNTAYDDEAISEVNYYERKTDEGGGAIRQDKEQEEERNKVQEDEAYSRPVKVEEEYIEKPVEEEPIKPQDIEEEPTANGLADGDYYSRMEGEIEGIFSAYPQEGELEKIIEGSRFVRIDYGEGKYYVFGVLTVEGEPRYICYGVPSQNPDKPPKSLTGCSSYIPCKDGGYWLMYQDAKTGVSVEIINE